MSFSLPPDFAVVNKKAVSGCCIRSHNRFLDGVIITFYGLKKSYIFWAMFNAIHLMYMCWLFCALWFGWHDGTNGFDYSRYTRPIQAYLSPFSLWKCACIRVVSGAQIKWKCFWLEYWLYKCHKNTFQRTTHIHAWFVFTCSSFWSSATQ